MGKYSGIKASSLYSLADLVLDEIDNGEIDSVINDFGDFRIMESPAGKNAKSALEDILDSKNINGSIINLKEKLETLKDAADAINDYQELEEEIESLNDDLYYTDYVYDDYTESWEEVTETDWNVYYQIQDAEAELEKLDNQISGLLS